MAETNYILQAAREDITGKTAKTLVWDRNGPLGPKFDRMVLAIYKDRSEDHRTLPGVLVASTVFGCWPCWESPEWGPQNEGRKERKGRRHEGLPLHPPFPSIKLLVSDSLWGSNSNISEAKNGGADYTLIERVPLTGKDVQGAWEGFALKFVMFNPLKSKLV
jgi:hypothetical protein